MAGVSTPDRERYMHGHHESVLRVHSRRTIANSAAYLEPELTPGSRLLDIGSGPGTITVEFAERLAPGEVIGLDASAEVVEQAAALAAGLDLANVRFEVGDAYALPFPDDAVDIVHAHQVLQHLADPVAALREMRRVVRPGGVVAIRDVDYGLAGWHPASPELADWLDLYQRVARANGGEPDAGRRLPAWARAAGFTDVRASASAWFFASDDDRAWWGGSWADRIVHSRVAEDARELGLADPDDLQRLRDGWLRWASDPDGSFLMSHGEVLARG
jgi:SAM-dependent methyltransferase